MMGSAPEVVVSGLRNWPRGRSISVPDTTMELARPWYPMGKLKKPGGGRSSLMMMRPAFLTCSREQEKSEARQRGVSPRGCWFGHTGKIANGDWEMHRHFFNILLGLVGNRGKAVHLELILDLLPHAAKDRAGQRSQLIQGRLLKCFMRQSVDVVEEAISRETLQEEDGIA